MDGASEAGSRIGRRGSRRPSEVLSDNSDDTTIISDGEDPLADDVSEEERPKKSGKAVKGAGGRRIENVDEEDEEEEA